MPVYTDPISSQLCDITDLASDVLDLRVRVALLESQMAQMAGSNVNTIYLSDLSQDLGQVLSGTVGPAVQIATIADYAMYAYGPSMSPSPIEVTGNVSITSNTSDSWAGPMSTNVYTRHIIFEVTNPGWYLCIGNGSFHIDFSGNQQVSAHVTMRAKRSDSIAYDLGYSQVGHVGIAQQSAANTVGFNGIWNDAGNVGEVNINTFRLEAGSQVAVDILPDWSDVINPPLTGATLSLYSVMVSLTKVSNL